MSQISGSCKDHNEPIYARRPRASAVKSLRNIHDLIEVKWNSDKLIEQGSTSTKPCLKRGRGRSVDQKNNADNNGEAYKANELSSDELNGQGSTSSKSCIKRAKGRSKVTPKEQTKSTELKSESLRESGKRRKESVSQKCTKGKKKKLYWSSDNVVLALSEIIKYKEESAKNIKLDFIQLAKKVGNALQLCLSRDQMYRKVLNLRRAYFRMEKAIKEGNPTPFENECEKYIYSLSKEIWGCDNDETKEDLQEDDMNENLTDTYDDKDPAQNWKDVIGSGSSEFILEDTKMEELAKRNNTRSNASILKVDKEKLGIERTNKQPRDSSEKIEADNCHAGIDQPVVIDTFMKTFRADKRPRADQLISEHVSNVSTDPGSPYVTKGFNLDIKEAERGKSLHNSGIHSDLLKELQNMHVKFLTKVKLAINKAAGSPTSSGAKSSKAIDDLIEFITCFGEGTPGDDHKGSSVYDHGTPCYGQQGTSFYGHGISCFGQGRSSYLDRLSTTKRDPFLESVEQERHQLEMEKLKLRTLEVELMLDKCKMKQEKLCKQVSMFK